LALLAVTPGCVTRKLFIRSDPPGARVMFDGNFVGTTPYEADFVYYGERRIDLELAGYEWLRSTVNIVQPWWQSFPVDIVTDLIWPGEIHDEQSFAFTLIPRGGESASFEDAQEAYLRLKARFAGHRDENEDATQP
jgi:hypothetical protein